VRCAKTAEPVEMPFWMKTRVGPRNHVLDGGTDPPRVGGNFSGLSGHSKVLAIFAATDVAASLSVRCKRDHGITQYARQAQIVFGKARDTCDAVYWPRRG